MIVHALLFRAIWGSPARTALWRDVQEAGRTPEIVCGAVYWPLRTSPTPKPDQEDSKATSELQLMKAWAPAESVESPIHTVGGPFGEAMAGQSLGHVRPGAHGPGPQQGQGTRTSGFGYRSTSEVPTTRKQGTGRTRKRLEPLQPGTTRRGLHAQGAAATRTSGRGPTCPS